MNLWKFRASCVTVLLGRRGRGRLLRLIGLCVAFAIALVASEWLRVLVGYWALWGIVGLMIALFLLSVVYALIVLAQEAIYVPRR